MTINGNNVNRIFLVTFNIYDTRTNQKHLMSFFSSHNPIHNLIIMSCNYSILILYNYSANSLIKNILRRRSQALLYIINRYFE